MAELLVGQCSLSRCVAIGRDDVLVDEDYKKILMGEDVDSSNEYYITRDSIFKEGGTL